VAAKTRPGDWDRLFAPNAPHRGGPLRALINVLVTIVVISLLGAGGVYAFRYRDSQIAAASATATAIAPTIAAIQTQTAQAEAQATATHIAQRTATAIARQPTAEPSLGTGVVISGGNLRKEAPRGDVIAVRSASGVELARGLSNYSSSEARLIARRPSADFERLLGFTGEPELIHRDNLVLS